MTQGISRRDRILEIFAAALMSIATVTTAWCAYQSAEWGGEWFAPSTFAIGARAAHLPPCSLPFTYICR